MAAFLTFCGFSLFTDGMKETRQSDKSAENILAKQERKRQEERELTCLGYRSAAEMI